MEDQCQIENREPEIENHKSQIENARRGIGGPKTEEGKRRSARNAMKYGIYASTEEGLAVLEQTIGCSYAEMLDRMRSCLNPRDALEDLLVSRIARSAWRMKVTQEAENNVLGRHHPGRVRIGKQYENVIHAERFIDVHLHRAVRALQAKRDKECEKSKNELRLIPIREGLHP